MTKTKTYRLRDKKFGKCPRCCPDGGACLIRTYDFSADENGVPAWECQNCLLKIPARALKPLAEPTAGQHKILDRIQSVFGGSFERVSMVGRTVFFFLVNDSRAWFDGSCVGGQVFANGRFTMEFSRLGCKTVVLNDWIGVGVYLGGWEKHQQPATTN